MLVVCLSPRDVVSLFSPKTMHGRSANMSRRRDCQSTIEFRRFQKRTKTLASYLKISLYFLRSRARDKAHNVRIRFAAKKIRGKAHVFFLATERRSWNRSGRRRRSIGTSFFNLLTFRLGRQDDHSELLNETARHDDIGCRKSVAWIQFDRSLLCYDTRAAV